MRNLGIKLLIIVAVILFNLIISSTLPLTYLPWIYIAVIIAGLFVIYIYKERIKKLSRYEKIYETISHMSRFQEIKSLLDFVVYSITDLLNAERTSLFIVNRETNTLWTLVAEDLEIKEITLPIGKGIAGYVAETGEIVNIKDDPYKDKRFLPTIDQKTGFKTKNILSVPVKEPQEGKVIAVVEVLNKKIPGGFTEDDIEILKVFCSELGYALSNAQLYETNRQLLESMFKSFAAAIDARDPTTRGHSLRTAKYALNIGKALNLSQREMKVLEYSSILHDIGKIGVPDSVLLKNKPFNKEEYDIMKTHALLTKEILTKIFFPEEYKDVPFIAATHHEFGDSSGYPFGLKKDQIPLLSRILCVADIYDALRSYDRPYKPPLSQEEAIKILHSMAEEGKLDKDIVELFISKELYKIEQREHVRVSKEFSFSWRKLGEEDIKSILPVITKTKDISAGGLKFITNIELPVNTFLEVELYLPNHTIELVAKVVRCRVVNNGHQFEVGIAFINLPKETAQKLERYLTTKM